MSRLSAVFLMVTAFGASGCQSEAAGLRVICDAPLNCTDCMNAPPDLRMQMLAQHIDSNLRNGEARALFESLAAAEPATRQESLTGRAKQLGIEKCPLADTFVVVEDVEVQLPGTETP